MIYLRYLFLLFIISSNVLFGEVTVTFQPIKEGILKGREFKLLVDNKEIGFLKYVKLPCLSWYVLYDFFIKKEYRNKGYGSQLFEITLQIIINNGASRIFIQPGPFDLKNGRYVFFDKNERMFKIRELVKWYQKYDFKRINNLFLSKLLSCLYLIMHIDEDPHFIMGRKVNS